MPALAVTLVPKLNASSPTSYSTTSCWALEPRLRRGDVPMLSI